MKKQREPYTPEPKVAIPRRHLIEGVPISDLCDELGLQPKVSLVLIEARVPDMYGYPCQLNRSMQHHPIS